MALLVKKSEIDLVGIDNAFEEAAAFFGLRKEFAEDVKIRKSQKDISDFAAMQRTLHRSSRYFTLSKGNGLTIAEFEEL